MTEDRKPGEMHRERSYQEYEDVLLGLDKSLKYMEKLNSTPLVLDIGTGSGKAAKHIMDNNPSMRVIGIDKVQHPQVAINIPGNFIQADASSMPQIADKSVDGMLLVHSIAYASESELPIIASELSRVAKDGALLKGSALHPLAQAQHGLKLSAIQISEALNQHGFVSVCASEFGIERNPTEDVFIAIKLSNETERDEIELRLKELIKEM